jgi:hypothetical protein
MRCPGDMVICLSVSGTARRVLANWQRGSARRTASSFTAAAAGHGSAAATAPLGRAVVPAGAHERRAILMWAGRCPITVPPGSTQSRPRSSAYRPKVYPCNTLRRMRPCGRPIQGNVPVRTSTTQLWPAPKGALATPAANAPSGSGQDRQVVRLAAAGEQEAELGVEGLDRDTEHDHLELETLGVDVDAATHRYARVATGD